MNGAYEGLMKAAPQAIQGLAQSMGGQAQPAGWAEGESAALKNMREISQQMKAIEDMYPDPNMQVHPAHAHQYSALESDLNQMRAMWEHAQGKTTEQAGFRTNMDSGKRTRTLIDEIQRATAGGSPPMPTSPVRK
jgi:hypothetical protein